MTTNKSADIKSVRAQGKAAINCFNKAALIHAMDDLAACKASEGSSKVEGNNASLHIVAIAAEYGDAAHAIANNDTSTVLQDWKENIRAVALELAAKGSPFAESHVNKAGETVGKLTGTGNNVLSIAKGVVDFRLVIADCANEEGEVSYRSVRATVEACRAQRRAEENPEMAALNDAKEAAREAAKSLLKVVLATNDVGLIDDLTGWFTDLELSQQQDIDAQIAEELAATEAESPASDANIAETLSVMEQAS